MYNTQHTENPRLGTATTPTASKNSIRVHATKMSAQGRCHHNYENSSKAQTCTARHGNSHSTTATTAVENKEPDMGANQSDAVTETMLLHWYRSLQDASRI